MKLNKSLYSFYNGCMTELLELHDVSFLDSLGSASSPSKPGESKFTCHFALNLNEYIAYLSFQKIINSLCS